MTQGLTASASRAREVRCTTQNEVAISALPPKPKMMPVVWTGRRRPKLVAGQGGVASGHHLGGFADAVVRLVPGVISDDQSALSDCFQDDMLSAPIYTRPRDYKGWQVPEILLSGNEAKIRQWEFDQATERTRRLRPDLLK